MATADPVDPGEGEKQNSGTYASRLKTNDQRLKRNVLEITLEKIDKNIEIVVDQECVARLCRSICMDIVTQVEGYQTHHFGSTSTITIWVVKDVNLKRFCRTEGINVSKGVMTGMIRPAGRKDVTVSVTGLDFNTPDSLMFNYIKKFGGSIISNEVIYSKFTEGPFRGKYSGERKYQVEFQKGFRSMGTYHFIDGAKIRIFYRGNEKSCGRCHEQARTCPGRGIARDCDKAGGPRVNLSEHMQRLWADIGFEPTTFALPTGDEESGEMVFPYLKKKGSLE